MGRLFRNEKSKFSQMLHHELDLNISIYKTVYNCKFSKYGKNLNFPHLNSSKYRGEQGRPECGFILSPGRSSSSLDFLAVPASTKKEELISLPEFRSQSRFFLATAGASSSYNFILFLHIHLIIINNNYYLQMQEHSTSFSNPVFSLDTDPRFFLSPVPDWPKIRNRSGKIWIIKLE